MDTNNPVGENRPPQFSAPQNEPPPAADKTTPPPADGTIPSSSPGRLIPAYAGAASGAAPGAAVRERQPFTATRADGLFAAVCFVVGFLFLRWGVGFLAGDALLAGMQGWGVTALCLLWGAAVLVYARAKGIKPPGASWYWLAVLVLCGLSFGLWPGGLLAPYRALLTVGAAVYWCGHLLGMPLAGKTGNYLPLDAVNMLFVVPLRNFGCAGASLKTLGGGAGRAAGLRRLLPVAAGLALSVPVLGVVVPLLASADSTGFGSLLSGLAAWLRNWHLWDQFSEALPVIAIQLGLAVPAGLYLFGLAGGGAHKRCTRTLDLKKAQQAMAALHLVPAATVLVMLGVVCGVYIVFIGCQLPYFFSAFAGAKPQQYTFYSEYARAGFFELCRIAAINLGLLAVAGAVCRRAVPGRRVPGLRLFNILLSALTVLVIATAFSKMGLYIARHGLTQKRVMTCVFMAFLAGVCLAVMVLQFKKFSIVRFAAVTGAGVLCALCLCNLDGLVVGYNAGAWQAGRLEAFDELMVARSGPAGAERAMEIYTGLDGAANPGQKQRLTWALYHIREAARATEGTSRDSLANRTARRVIVLPQEQLAEARRQFETHFEAQLARGGYE